MSDGTSEGIREQEVTLTSVGKEDYKYVEAKGKPRVYGFLNGPYLQHQLFVECVHKLQQENADIKGHLWSLTPCYFKLNGKIFAYFLWVLSLLLPFVFIVISFFCYSDALVCVCCVGLCLLIAFHSIIVFLVIHNNKTARKQWFVMKVDLPSYFGYENSVVEVNLDNIMSLQFMSGGQKSSIISRLARMQGSKTMVMLYTKSFWTSRILDPLLCLLLLITLSVIALVVNVELIREKHF